MEHHKGGKDCQCQICVVLRGLPREDVRGFLVGAACMLVMQQEKGAPVDLLEGVLDQIAVTVGLPPEETTLALDTLLRLVTEVVDVSLAFPDEGEDIPVGPLH